MFFEKFGDDFVLGLNPVFEFFDLFALRVTLAFFVGGILFFVESTVARSRRAILPVVVLSGVNLMLVAQIGDWHAFEQVGSGSLPWRQAEGDHR